MATVIELPIQSYEGLIDPDWCPGCGDFGVLKALKIAAGRLGIKPKDLIVVSGIGCSSNLPGFIHSYGVHSLHGRAVAVAEGIKLASVGAVAGLAGSLLVARWLSRVTPTAGGPPLWAWLAAPLVLMVSVAIASVLPARRAASVDPLTIMRDA